MVVAKSQNKWPVIFDEHDPRLRTWKMPGHDDRHFNLQHGCAGFLLIHNAVWFHDVIERLDLGVWDEWGHAVRPVRGQTSGYSNHASGTATDLNATRHPRGVATLHTFTPGQVSKIHNRLKIYRGTVRWGGDYTKVPDAMHFEINAPLAEVEARARSLMNTPRGKAILAVNPGAKAVILS